MKSKISTKTLTILCKKVSLKPYQKKDPEPMPQFLALHSKNCSMDREEEAIFSKT